MRSYLKAFGSSFNVGGNGEKAENPREQGAKDNDKGNRPNSGGGKCMK